MAAAHHSQHAPQPSAPDEIKDDPASPCRDSSEDEGPAPAPASRLRRVLQVLNYKPKWVEWNAEKPPQFSIWMNILFAFAGAFTVANLYYNQPILNVLARHFDVTYEQSSHIPTLAQSGYCAGLLLLCPCGDKFKRRPFVLLLVFISATMWIPLCVTNNFTVFQLFSFLNGVTTVTPQLMLPLVGDLAPPHRRAMALSIVSSGNILGILIARILSGVVANFTSWRNVYWIALALQGTIFVLLWLFMVDYPATTRLSYLHILGSIFRLVTKYAVLVQACLVGFVCSAVFTNFWTTITFLLAGPPYHYSTLVIGLFALVNLPAIVLLPAYARWLIEPYVPLFATVLAVSIALTGTIIGAYTGEITLAGPLLMALLIDIGFQISQVANRSAIYALEPHARSRINTAYMLSTFLGQITGTSAGNALYARGGWIVSASLSVGLLAAGIAACLARGPWETGWLGWHGGCSIRKKNANSADGFTEERAVYGGRAWGAREGDVEARKGDVEGAVDGQEKR